MSKGGQKQTVTTANDAGTQAHVDQMRQMASQGATDVMNGGQMFTGPISGADITGAMNPFLQNVIGGVRGEFDHLRNQAVTGANQQATQAGAFGGSRHGVMAGARLGELDRAQASQIGGLLNSGYGQATNLAMHNQGLQQQQNMEPLFRQQQALGMMNMGMGPMGQTQTTQGPGGSKLGSAAGGALTGASIGSIFPGVGTAVGAGVGGLAGLLGWL